MGRSEIANFLREKQNERSVQHKRRHCHGDHPRHHGREQKYLQEEERYLEPKDAGHSIENINSAIEGNQQATSGASKPSSWINVFANTIVDTVKGVSQFISPPSRAALPLSSGDSSDHSDTAGNSSNRSGTVRNPNIQYTNQFSREVCAGNNARFMFSSLQAFLDKQFPLPRFSDVPYECAFPYASDIVDSFEKALEQQAKLKDGIQMHRLGIDFGELKGEITERIVDGESNEIPGILRSCAEKALPGREAGCPGRLSQKKFDEFNNRLDVVIGELIVHDRNVIPSRNRISEDKVKEIYKHIGTKNKIAEDTISYCSGGFSNTNS